ncbi:MAG: hypothetical protein AB1705_12190 [Verrucomicrobiota bacterium]
MKTIRHFILAGLAISILITACDPPKPATSNGSSPGQPAKPVAVSVKPADEAPPAPPPPVPPGSPPTAAPRDPTAGTLAKDPTSPFNEPDQGANDKAMAELNAALRKFYKEHQRAPYDADELVSEKFIEAVPKAPPGKEYFYDSVALKFKLINKRPE